MLGWSAAVFGMVRRRALSRQRLSEVGEVGDAKVFWSGFWIVGENVVVGIARMVVVSDWAGRR